ncbi:putative F-box-like domain superfamily protein [Septoria linicola]|nr:putative F-box-like domain superfamily protein [Septoria linicola]
MEPSPSSVDSDTDSDTESLEVLFEGRGGSRRLELACVPRVDVLQRSSEAKWPDEKQLRIGYDPPKHPAEDPNCIAGRLLLDFDPLKRPAALRTFGVYELTERILASVSAEDVFYNAMRVCKQWNEVVASSSILQQKLFFQPIPGPAVKFVQFDYDCMCFVACAKPHPQVKVTQNPFMRRLRKELEALEGYACPERAATRAYKALPKQRKQALLRADASYYKMLAFQPPLTSLSFPLRGTDDRDSEDGGPFASEAKTVTDVTNAEGVRIWDTILRRDLRVYFELCPEELNVAV